MNELAKLKKASDEKEKEYRDLHNKYAKARDAIQLESDKKKYEGKFFRYKYGKNSYLFIISVERGGRGECIEFSFNKEPIQESIIFSYTKQFYYSGMLGKEINRSDASGIVKAFLEHARDFFPQVDFLDE